MAGYESLQETMLARESIELLRARNFDALRPKLAPETRDNPDLSANLSAAAAQFPDGEPVNVKLVGYNFLTFASLNNRSTTTNYTISFEYEFPDAWVVALTTLRALMPRSSS